ncbi:MAG: hypothetical protein R2856_30865 [Caldilineaceae bacterium]
MEPLKSFEEWAAPGTLQSPPMLDAASSTIDDLLADLYPRLLLYAIPEDQRNTYLRIARRIPCKPGFSNTNPQTNYASRITHYENLLSNPASSPAAGTR